MMRYNRKMQTTIRQEIRELTVLRVLAILSLLLTHLHDYVNAPWLWAVYPRAGDTCNSTFIFIAGYLLGRARPIKSGKDLFDFSVQKISRIYSLYAPALLVFLVLYAYPYPNGFLVFATHVTSLQIIIGKVIPPYFTIWFVGLIVPYYFLFALSAFITSKYQNAPKWLVLTVSFLGLNYILLGSICDSRFFFFFPSFVAGLFVCERGYLDTGRSLAIVPLSGFGLIILAVVLFRTAVKLLPGLALLEPLSKVLGQTAYVCIIPLVLLVATHYAVRKGFGQSPLTGTISYCSFAVYMFHRPILTAVQWGVSHLPAFNLNVLFLLYTIIVIPFIVFPVCYFIQRAADTLLTRSLAVRRRGVASTGAGL